MVMQEALADIFGLLLCSHERSANELNIDNTKLARIYLLEMLRYMRRGPCDFPDAGAAYVQFKFLVECGCLKITENGNVSVYLERFYPSITKLAKHLTENILQGDDESAALFISKYCPNNDLQDCAKLIDTIGIVADTIEYEQKIREV
ncbi:hypothetical protein EAO82_08790 [Halopseudomonas pelagia]|uniref:Uncharacterized protein n=2 Tax=Halopseudomonas pelagia TaxID=553151 RepID=A0AA91U678_9GAMM|nr:hypothetical protein CO192_01910 [Halopseudomonas pelagia]QFY56448.1 hypothetical protein EAO82_08790 [Halopseudomonas pelagia]